MELVYFSNEFPKDDLQQLYRRLQNHGKSNDHTMLASFIQNATSAIKDEVRQLPTELKQQIPPFESLLSWADRTDLREGSLCGAVDGVLLVVTQIAAYIGYIESHPGELRNFDITSLSALGVGLFSAAAVSLSPTLRFMPLAGADAVRLAFRMGIHVQSVSENLESRDDSEKSESWAYVIHNASQADVQKELDTIHSREQVPDTGKVFLSAVSRTSVTISGPPSRLKALFNKSEFFRTSRSIELPVFGGLCHAPHIYTLQDTKSIVRRSSLNATNAPVMPIYSTSTGQFYSASNAAEVFESVVSELLSQAISWDTVISGVASRCTGLATATLHSFGNSIPLLDLEKALKSGVPGMEVSTKNLMRWISDSPAVTSGPCGAAQSKLAIVGMSCRLPGGATDTEKFWDILEQGLDVSRRIPADRFDIDTHYDPTGKQLNMSMTQYGCFIDEPGMFDAPFFNMSPREAQTVDPQMRLSLVTAYEALERAGYVSNRTASTRLERIGTYYGQAADDYREVNQGQEISTYYIPGGCRAFGPGRINYFFKFAGPSYSIDTACSSGLASIEVACQALWNGTVDMAVAGGVNVLTNPDGFAGLGNGHFLTKGHNACKTWDATADGYCRADGVGSVVIKRLEDAQADNDNILGVILGAGTNHSAEAVSITHPHAGHQAFLARQVLRQAGVDPLDIGYIELHGTGTQAGDYEEMSGTLEVYAPLNKHRSQPLHIGAVKSNVGHGESVAGTTALIKVLLMLQKNLIPRHIGIKTEINPRFPKDFDKRNLHIPFVNKTWPQLAGTQRLAAINNFGAAGGNTMMVLEEAPPRVVAECDVRETHIVAVSAKTKTSLGANIERLIGYLKVNPETSLPDLSYTTTTRRAHYTHRVAIATTTVPNLIKQLEARLAKVDSIKPVGKSDPPQIAFAFTGQGASHKSMSLELYRDVATFRDTIHRLDALARGQGFPSFVPALDGSHPKDHVHSPVITQLALVCTEIALARYWQSLGVKPDVVIGHSLGEYAAMHIAGVVSANDTVFMVGRRAQLLQQKCTIGSHTMMAVRASLSQIEESSDGKPYTVACINGPTDTVLSGTTTEISEVAVLLEAKSYRCIKLDVAYAFHSEQTDPILDDFEIVAKGVRFGEPKLPVISPLVGKVVFDGKTLNANYVRTATREAVDFYSALENAEKVGTIGDETVWIEIGPHPVCTNFVKSTLQSVAVAVPSIRRDDDNWKTMAESMAALHLAGVQVGWNEFNRPFESRLRLLDLPTYSFNDKNHWLQYNGDWCLTKGNTFYATETVAKTVPKIQYSEIQTSTVQQIIEQEIEGHAGLVVMQSDLMQPDFLAAANGHRMNDCGVVTSSIHADIAYTLAGHLYRKFHPKTKNVPMNVANLMVVKGLVANGNRKIPQLMQVSARVVDIRTNVVDMTWQNVDANGNLDEPFATAKVLYGDSTSWLNSWSPTTHLIQGRIEALESLAAQGKANRFSRNMAYTLFASNLVDYADKYRGMQSVVMHGLEAFADVELTTKESGTWTVAPYFIDSVAHLAGFVMNCSDAIDTKTNYCVTPGWDSMRFAKPLIPGAKYRSYVKMIPTAEDPTVYFGDVYIMQSNVIVGMVGGIQFRSFPRILLGRFFSPPDKTSAAVSHSSAAVVKPRVADSSPKAVAPSRLSEQLKVAFPNAPSTTSSQSLDGQDSEIESSHHTADASSGVTTPDNRVTVKTTPDDSITVKALQLIANEGALEVSDLEDDTSFADLGIDSLMSLVLSEKFRSELDVKVSGSLFLDYPTIGDLRKWLDEYYS